MHIKLINSIQLQFILFAFIACIEIYPSMSNKEFSTVNEVNQMLIPCFTQDSIFKNGICTRCIDSRRYAKTNPFKECREFETLGSKTSEGRSDLQLPILFPIPSSKNYSTICQKGFGCLKFESDIGKMRRLLGASYLNTRIIRAVTIQRPPFVKIKDGDYSGVCFEFFFAMQAKYNFTSYIFPPYDGNWGSETLNGTWNGMVGQVIRKEADIGVAGFSVTLQRAEVVTFTQSYHQESTGILIPPPTEGEKFSVLIRPLSAEVWIAVLATMTILAPTLYAMHVTSLRIAGERNYKGFWSMIGDLIHFMIGSLVQESVISPVNKTTRFLIILWWFLTLIVANVYVAYLVSYLSAPKLHNSINGLEDLVHQDQIQWTFRKNTAHQSLFKSKSSGGVYKAVGDGVLEEDLVTSDMQGVDKVITGEFAFIKEKSYLDVALANDFVRSHQCRMTLAKEEIFKVGTALIVQKRSKFLDVFDYGISWTVATGLMEKWKVIHWPRETWCEDAASYITETKPKVRKLTVDDLQGAAFLLTCGIIISIFGFLLELLIKYFTKSQKEQTPKAKINLSNKTILIRIQKDSTNIYPNYKSYYFK